MLFRCMSCGAAQFRGIVPDATAPIRSAIFHGIAVGSCGILTKITFARLGHTVDGWISGLASLGVCGLFLIGYYGISMLAETRVAARLRCRHCGQRQLHANSIGELRRRPSTAADVVAGQLYAVRQKDGTYRVLKVLVVDETAVHLRCYANRFDKPPARVSPSELSLGGLGNPEGFGIGHFPLARESFDRDERILVGHEPVRDDELDGYRIWAGEDPSQG